MSSSTAAESFTSQSSLHASDHSHRRIDITTMKKSEMPRDHGPLGTVMTVVRSCPAVDTLAILVLLSQLGPIILSAVYMLFTFLTFVPSAAPTSFNSLSVATVKDVLQESTFKLSFLTVLLVDTIIFLVWLFLSDSGQNLVLGASKAVIALTLGGGIGALGGGWKNIIVCACFIAFSNLTKHVPFELWLRWTLGKWLGTIEHPPRPPDPIPFSQLRFAEKVGRGVMSILAIHIFSQGVMRYVRDWLLQSQRRENKAHSMPDPEAGKSFPEISFTDTSSPLSDVGGDGLAAAAAAATAAAAAAATSPTSHVVTAAVSARKKRKHGAQVRQRQPLWAALASTKIVMAKEMELSKDRELGGKEAEPGNIVSATFPEREEQIWLSEVDSEEAFFVGSNFADYPPSDCDDEMSDKSCLIDTNKPFYVRINNAVWPSVHMFPERNEDEAGGLRWKGRILGLPSGSTFACEFVSTCTERVLYTTSFRTQPALAKDTDTSPSPVQTQRPESPVTTLKSSIKKLDAKFADEKMRLKTTKRDGQTKIKSHKKELERLSSSIQSSGNNDCKYRSKIQTNSHLKQQYEEQASQFEVDLCHLRSQNEALAKPKDETDSRYKQAREMWVKEQAHHKAFKASLEKENNSREAESTCSQNKRNKIATRLARVDGELAKHLDINVQGRLKQERRTKDLEQLEANGTDLENHMRWRVQTQMDKLLSLKQQYHTMGGVVGQYYKPTQLAGVFGDTAANSQLNPAAPHYSPPFGTINLTPPGFNPNRFSWSSTLAASGWGSSIGNMGCTGSGENRTRGRSSSILSNVSGLTRFSDGCDTVSTDATVLGAGPRNAPQTISPPPGFTGPSPVLVRSAAGLHHLNHADTAGSGGSGSGGGSPP